MAGRTVYVGNVSAATPEQTLRELFGRAGAVTDLRIAGKPGYNNVYCFVEFQHASSAKAATCFNGSQLSGNTIRVSMAKANSTTPSSTSPVASPVLPPLTSYNFNPALAAALSAYSAALQPSALMQAEAQARLLNLPAFNTQLLQSNIQLRNNVKPKKPHHDPNKVQRTIYIENVAASVDEQALADHFRQHGPIVAVRLAAATDAGKKKGWIEFAQEPAALAAQGAGAVALAGSTLKVQPSRTAIHTNGLAQSTHAQEVQAAALANLQAQQAQQASQQMQTLGTQTHNRTMPAGATQLHQPQPDQSSDLTTSTSFPSAACSPRSHHAPAPSKAEISVQTHDAEDDCPGRSQAASPSARPEAGQTEPLSCESSPLRPAGGTTGPNTKPFDRHPAVKRGLDKATSTELPQPNLRMKRCRSS